MGRGKRRQSEVRTAVAIGLGRLTADPWAELATRLGRLSNERRPGSPMSPRELTRYAYAIIHSAGLETGDVLAIEAQPDERELAIALSLEAYRAGAREVRVLTSRQLMTEMGSLDGERDRFAALIQPYKVLSDADEGSWEEAVEDSAVFVTINSGGDNTAAHEAFDYAEDGNRIRWCLVQWPTKEHVCDIYGTSDRALRKFAEDILFFNRCSAADPLDGLERHFEKLRRRAHWLNRQQFDAIIIENDETGTKLEFGLLDTSEFRPCEWETSDGKQFRCNLPTEEVFCTPDPKRTNGTFVLTRPLTLDGQTFHGVKGRFHHGRLLRKGFVAGSPAHSRWIYNHLKEHPGLLQVGELALIGKDSRVARKSVIYGVDAIDENAGVHFALGDSYRAGLRDHADDPRRNRQPDFIHSDLTIGSRDDVYGRTSAGELVPIMLGGIWQH